MRIVFVSLMNGLPWGGSEALWCATAKHAVLEGHSVMVSVYKWEILHEKILELKNLGCLIHTRTRYNASEHWISKLSYALSNKVIGEDRFYKSVFRFKPDIVIISQGGAFDLAVHHRPLYNNLKGRRIPYILISHSQSQFSEIPGPAIFPNAVEILKNAVTIFYVSKRMKLYAERQLCSILVNSKLTWNPLNINNKDAVTWPNNSVTQMAVVGALSGAKGSDMVITALSGEEWQDRDWRLNVYGDGVGREYLQDLVKFLRLEKKVVFHGYVTDIRSIWKNNHILLIGSASEGMPISLVEAMICARPAVVTDVGGNSEMIKEGFNGFIAESPYFTYISSALERAWQQKESWYEMGMKARKLALEKVNLQPEITLYDEILTHV